MQSVVERILEGNFNKDNHTLDFSTPVIELNINAGEIYEGSFTIYGPRDVMTEGRVSSTRLRMKCLVESFAGSESQVPFSFDSTGMSFGDSFKGEFRIISNQGEYLVPYDITIGNENLDTSLGNIKNLFHFINLARTNWNEAVELFHSRDFEAILSGSDKMHMGSYMVLVNGPNKQQNLEEFLLQIKKKQPADFIIEEPNVRIDNVLGELEKYIIINRNGWGYSELDIECSDDFIVLSKTSISDEDFIGNVARIPYSILDEKLHEGRNYGRIVLKNAYNDIKITICVIKHPINRKTADFNRVTKHHMVNLMNYYEAFRCRKISSATWMQETSKIIDELVEVDKDCVIYQLMHAQILVTAERYNEARWILEQTESYIATTDDDTLYSYYYYLTTLVNRSESNTDRVMALVSHIYSQDMTNWRVGWLLMYLSEEYARSTQKRWEFLSEQFRYGSRSPVTYVEAFQILQNNPTVMGNLGDFEIQVLKYMARKEILTPDVIEQFIYLFGRSKVYKKNLLPLLISCYKVLPSTDVLQAICILLINLGLTTPKAFEWYAKAIEAELKITKLYEYYILSIDMDAIIQIPKMVLMYFAFDSSLDTLHNAYLYAYVYRNKAEFPELFDNYKSTIERFVAFEIQKGNNNQFLAYLYKNIITESMITPEVASGLVKAIFVHKITFTRKNIVSMLIKYDNITEVYTYPVKENHIYVPLYGNNYQIVLFDDKENAFTREEEFEIERLMMPDKLASYIAEYVEDDILFDLWMCEHGKDLYPISKSNAPSMRRIADSLVVMPKIKKEIKLRLARFYYEEDMMEELDSLLNEITIGEVSSSAFAEIVHSMVIRGMYEKAYEWICACSGENIEAKTISRLCTRMLSLEEYITSDQEDPTMSALCYRAFVGGKYDDASLKYFVEYFSGTSREMKEIWKAAKEYGVDTTKLEVRILTQMLYTNAYVGGITQLIAHYNKKVPNTDLVLAVLAQFSYDYFVLDKVIDEELLDILQTYIDNNCALPMVCKLAYTKYYSQFASDLPEMVSRTLVVYLRQIIAEGMFFPYFKEYASTYTFMHRFLDKTIVEYRGSDGSRATIHYMMEKNGKAQSEYLKEEMKDMFHGIFVKMFVLFFGEQMQYYIVENKGDEEMLNESGSFSRNDMDEHESNSKYSMINDIAISRTLGDYSTMEKLLKEYYQYDYLCNKIFKMSE